MPRQKSSHSKPFTHTQRGKQRGSRHRAETGQIVIFGLHAVEAALANPNRPVLRLLATKNAAHRLGPLIAKRALDEAHPDYPVPRIMTRSECEDLVRTLLP